MLTLMTPVISVFAFRVQAITYPTTAISARTIRYIPIVSNRNVTGLSIIFSIVIRIAVMLIETLPPFSAFIFCCIRVLSSCSFRLRMHIYTVVLTPEHNLQFANQAKFDSFLRVSLRLGYLFASTNWMIFYTFYPSYSCTHHKKVLCETPSCFAAALAGISRFIPCAFSVLDDSGRFIGLRPSRAPLCSVAAIPSACRWQRSHRSVCTT